VAPQGEPRSPCSGYSMLPGARGFTRSLLPNPNQPFAARRSICPPVVPFTQEIAARHGMQERASVQPGNYVRGDFADGYGLVLLANTLRTEGVKICQTPLGKVFKALSPGRQFVIHGVVPNPDYVTPLQPATFQLQISLSFPGGGHPAEAICDRATGAGAADLAVTCLPSSAFSSPVTSRKPA
jgi:hypothetical protein